MNWFDLIWKYNLLRICYIYIYHDGVLEWSMKGKWFIMLEIWIMCINAKEEKMVKGEFKIGVSNFDLEFVWF